jgi:hypothetical protein
MVKEKIREIKRCEWKGFAGMTYMVPTETDRKKK